MCGKAVFTTSLSVVSCATYRIPIGLRNRGIIFTNRDLPGNFHGGSWTRHGTTRQTT